MQQTTIAGSTSPAFSISSPLSSHATPLCITRTPALLLVRRGAPRRLLARLRRRLSKNGTADNPIVIKAEGSNAIISAPNTDTDGTRGNVYVHFSSYIIIDGLKAYNGAGALGTGLSIGTSPHVTIRNVLAGNSSWVGIYTGFADYFTVENCETYGSADQHGIYIANTTHYPTVRRNLIHDNNEAGLHMNGDQYTDPETSGTGMVLYTGALTYTITDALIENNIIYNNVASGINMDGGRYSIIRNNIAWNNMKGITLYQTDALQPPANDKVYNNTVINSSYAALRLTTADRPIYLRNNIVISDGTSCPNLILTELSIAETQQYIDSDYNIWVGDAAGAFGIGGGPCNTSFSAWQQT